MKLAGSRTQARSSYRGITRRWVVGPSLSWSLLEYTEERLVLRAELEHGHTRPGGMVAGPILFTLADTAAYFVTISRSPKRSEAYTSSISMEFLRPSPVGTLFVEARSLRFGKRSSVVDTIIRLRRRSGTGCACRRDLRAVSSPLSAMSDLCSQSEVRLTPSSRPCRISSTRRPARIRRGFC